MALVHYLHHTIGVGTAILLILLSLSAGYIVLEKWAEADNDQQAKAEQQRLANEIEQVRRERDQAVQDTAEKQQETANIIEAINKVGDSTEKMVTGVANFLKSVVPRPQPLRRRVARDRLCTSYIETATTETFGNTSVIKRDITPVYRRCSQAVAIRKSSPE
jgi:hypothetical protein